MAADNPRGAMFRVLMPDRQARVTNAELFFDLVFVFAVTQLSHTLLNHFTPLGAVQVTLLFLAVWWVWVYTTWVTNWLDPEQTPVRILLFLLMLGGLVLSTTIPTAFEGRGLWFAIAYAAMQIGRTAFWLLATLTGSIAMWWIYFHRGAEAGAEMISRSAESGRVARLAYTYLHMPIVGGIILAAVADELVLKHPLGHSDLRTVLSAVGGPLLFLVGTVLFKHAIRGFLQLSHGVGIIAFAAAGWFGHDLSPLWLSILTTAIMIMVAVWESLSLRSKPEE